MISYSDDTRIILPELTIEFSRQAMAPGRIIAQPGIPVTHIAIARDIDLPHPVAQDKLARIVMKAAEALAPRILLPMAQAIASDTGAFPAGWRIARGRRILGTCNSRREISLSAACIFLPDHLRRYIVCHELAHLREMNHSPRFHALCNEYCGGREKEFYTELKRFNWPFPPRIRQK